MTPDAEPADTITGKYRPRTDEIGFLQAPLKSVITFANSWLCPQGREPAEMFRASFDEAVSRIIPRDSWKLLFIECRSGWTSVFTGAGPVRHIAKNIHCQGVLAKYIEDTYNPKTREGEMGSVPLQVFKPYLNADRNNYGRTIALINDEGRWRFHVSDDPLPFEDASRYTARRVRDRFTLELLIEYLRALGIDAHNRDFYTDKCALFHPPKPTYFGDKLMINGVEIG